jgi:hypothetical protein
VFASASSQSSPPTTVGLLAWVSFHPAQATNMSPSMSISLAGTTVSQSLSSPSQSSVAPGKVLGSRSLQSVTQEAPSESASKTSGVATLQSLSIVSSQSPPATIGRATVESP